jgi:hypothetical protein
MAHAPPPPSLSPQLFWRRRALIVEDQLLRALGTGWDKLTNPHALWLRQSYGRSYYQFKPSHYYWVTVIVARKFGISTAALLFRMNPRLQLAAVLFVLFLAYAAQVRGALECFLRR